MAYFGAHTTGNPRDGFGDLLEAKARVVTSVDQDVWPDIQRFNGGYTTLVFRDTNVYLEAPGDLFKKESTEEYWDADRQITWDQLAEYWYSKLKPIFDLNEANYYTFTNEQGGGEGPDDELRRNYFILVHYERAMAKLLNADGKKACVLNLATGSPGNFDIWKEICAPFIAEMWELGNVYGRHVYGTIDGNLVDENGNMYDGGPSRPIEEILYLNDQGHYGGVVITECGLDAGSGFAGIERFTFQMTKYCEELQTYDVNDCIIGICGWNLGPWKTSNASYSPAIPSLKTYMLNNPLPEWQWPKGEEPPPTGENFIRNWSFEEDWYHMDGIPELQIPDKWGFSWADETVENPHDPNPWAKFVRPEVRVLPSVYLPSEERDLFILHGDQTCKVFKGHGSISFAMMQNILCPAGDYTLRIRVFPDLVKDYTEDGDKIWADDRDGRDGLIQITVGSTVVLPWTSLVPGRWNELTIEEHFPVNEILIIEFMCPFPLANNGFFMDAWELEAMDTPPPDETFEQKAWRITSQMQATGDRAIQLNAESAIQLAVSFDNEQGGHDYQIVSMEEWIDGKPVSAVESLSGMDPRRVYVWEPATGEVWYFLDPGTDPPPPPPPDNFSLTTYPVFMIKPHVTAPYNQPRSYGLHEGIDLRVWNSPGDPLPYIISGAPNGVVEGIRSYDPGSGYGKYVRVAYHGFEPGVVWKVWYCHLSEIQAGLHVGDEVVESQILGTAGSTGNSTGPHLHLTVQRIPGGLSGYVIDSVVDPFPLIEALTEPPPPPPPTGINIADYLFGDGKRYYLRNSVGGQELLQTQYSGERIFQTKTSAWESFFLTDRHICRDTDTSPGGGRYYTLRDHSGDISGSRWLPLRMTVGEVFTTNPLRVQFYNKIDCSPSSHQSGDVQNTYRFVGLHKNWESRFGFFVDEVIEIRWVNGGETYFYGKGYGLVGWERSHHDPNTPSWSSLVSNPEDGHNVREHISCL